MGPLWNSQIATLKKKKRKKRMIIVEFSRSKSLSLKWCVLHFPNLQQLVQTLEEMTI